MRIVDLGWFRRRANGTGNDMEPMATPYDDIRTNGHGRAEPRHGRTAKVQADPTPIAPVAADALPDASAAYGFGVADGRKQVDPANFSDYLKHSVQEEEVEAKLADLQRRDAAIESRATAVRQERENLAALRIEVESLEGQIEEAKPEIEALDREFKAAQEDRDRVRHLGLFSYVLIFGITSIAFILADVVITREFVADALELTGRRFLGIDESWFFAIALALLAIVLKPAYDRLVEKRYWNGDTRSFNVTILVTCGLALVTLTVLGVFRSVAFEAHTLGNLQLNAPNADPAETWQVFRALQETVVQSWWGKAAFVLSGVLFAVAGAICLGIGLRHFHDWRNVRRPAMRRFKDLDKRRSQSLGDYRQMCTRRFEALKDMHRTEARLENMPEPGTLEAQLSPLLDERRQLLERRSEIRQERLVRLYADGYEMGKRLGDPASPQRPSGSRRKRPRPYVAVRRAIRTGLPGSNHDRTSPT